MDSIPYKQEVLIMITEWLFVSIKYIFHPEQINQTEFKETQKRWLKETVRRQGKEVLAEDSKVIMVDNFRNVTVRIYEFRQFKSYKLPLLWIM
jgi:hypothetical protein